MSAAISFAKPIRVCLGNQMQCSFKLLYQKTYSSLLSPSLKVLDQGLSCQYFSTTRFGLVSPKDQSRWFALDFQKNCLSNTRPFSCSHDEEKEKKVPSLCFLSCWTCLWTFYSCVLASNDGISDSSIQLVLKKRIFFL